MHKLAATEKSSGIVRRETGTEYRGRAIMVEMRPPALLVFRLKGTRREYTISAVTAFELAVKIAATADAKRQRDERKARKAAKE
jgi:hypothetical protein